VARKKSHMGYIMSSELLMASTAVPEGKASSHAARSASGFDANLPVKPPKRPQLLIDPG